MDKVITFDFSQDLIRETAGFVERNFKDASRLAFVFGGKRPALFLKRELARRRGKAFFGPRFFSIDEFMEYCLRKRGDFSMVRDMDACFTIYNLVKKTAPDILKSRQGFSQFLPWAKEILGFIEQLDLEAIGPDALKNIQFKAQIGYDVPQDINKLLEGIILIREKYHSHLRKENKYSRGLVYLSASECANDVSFGEFDCIIFCNFYYLHKTEMAVMKDLYEKDKAALIFQADNNKWSVFDKISDEISHQIKPESPKKNPFKLSVYSGFDVHSEVALARHILSGMKRHDNTVVVLPEPANLIPLLSEISACVKDFNVSVGYPLNRSSVYSLMEHIFRAQETRQADKYYAKDYLKALAHPLVKNLKIYSGAGLTRVLVHKIEEIILGTEKTVLGGSLFVNTREVEGLSRFYDVMFETLKDMQISPNRDEIRELLQKLHGVLFTQWENVPDFNGFSLCLENLLDLLVKNSSLNTYPLNLKMIERMFSIKDEFGSSAFKNEPFLREDIFRIFREKLSSEKISFTGSPLKGLQVLGLFETRSLNFENVIVMDVNESVLPSLKIREPLIPREAMISLGLNRIEKEEEIQRYQFRRLILSAKNAHLIYQARPDKQRSRFLEELVWEEEKKQNRPGVVAVQRAGFKVKVLPKKLQIPKTADVVKFLKGMEYSASSVNTYLHCPLKFYYQYVLGLKEKDELLDEPQGADIGTFIHELLERTFSSFINKKPFIDARFKDMFFSVMDKKFADEFQKKMRSDAFLIKEVLDVRLQRFLDSEAKRDVKEVLCLEKEFKNRLKLSGEEFGFKAIVDRIDLFEDGSALILDYKTGDTDIMPDTNIERIKNAGLTREALKKTVKSFQLPLYLYMVGNDDKYRSMDINAALYFIKNVNKDFGIAKLLKSEEQVANRSAIINVYLEALGAVLNDILDTAKPFQADTGEPRQCGFCPFFYLCR